MAEVVVRVCDRCNEVGKPTKHYKIQAEGETAETDLCEQHSKPLREIMDSARSEEPAPSKRQKSASPKQGRRRRQVTKLTTIDQINAEVEANKGS